ncbi:hypothetical protein BpHYR1_043483, partial [Brachionus plicatilis]
SEVRTQLPPHLSAYRHVAKEINATTSGILLLETPHITTKVAPAQLMMGYSRTSGFPQLSAPACDLSGNQAAHRFAQENDRKAKEVMKREYNARMRVQQSELKVGDLVLLKLQRVCKTTPEWDPEPYVITERKGSSRRRDTGSPAGSNRDGRQLEAEDVPRRDPGAAAQSRAAHESAGGSQQSSSGCGRGSAHGSKPAHAPDANTEAGQAFGSSRGEDVMRTSLCMYSVRFAVACTRLNQ